MANISLSNAKSDRKDEFYTELKDIGKILQMNI